MENNMNKENPSEKVPPKKKSKGKKRENYRKVEMQIKKKVAFEEKAFRIVEKLVETQVNTDRDLMEAGQSIDKVMYEDVVEERSIVSVCGYPVCGNVLKSVTKQKYHISTQSNKVYDISDRKRYCSGLCYKASKLFSNQISSSPVWSRENEPAVVFRLMDRGNTQERGIPGECVIDHPSAEIHQQLKEIEKMDRQMENKQPKSLVEEPPAPGDDVTAPVPSDDVSNSAPSDDITTLDDIAKQLIDLHLLNREEPPAPSDDVTTPVPSDDVSNPAPSDDVTTLDDVAKQLIDLHLLNGADPEFNQPKTEAGAPVEEVCVEDRQGSLSTEVTRETPLAVEQIEIEVDNSDNKPETRTLTETDPDSDMDPRRYHKIRPKREALNTRDVVTTNYKHDMSGLGPNYCDRNSADKSHGHINRATYYGFDDKQEAAKALVCREILRCVIKITETGALEQQSHDSTEQSCSVPSEPSNVPGDTCGVPNEPCGARQGTQAHTVATYKKLGLTKLCRLGFLREPMTVRMSAEIHRVLVGKEDSRDSVSSSSVSGTNQTTMPQNQTQYLMDLIDTHEELKDKLNTTEESLKTAQKNITVSVLKTDVVTQESLNAKTRTNDSDLKKTSTVRNNHGILENIMRVSQQHVSSEKDSVKDSDDEAEEEVVGIQRNGSTLSNAPGLSVNATCSGKKSKEESFKQVAATSPLDNIAQILVEWKTVETCKYFRDRGKKDEKAEFHRKYTALSRRVDAQIREHSHFLEEEEPSYLEATKKVPEFSHLVTEVKGQDLKVKETCSATGLTTEGSKDLATQGKKKKLFDHEVEELSVYNRDELITEQGVHLPYVDSHSQSAIRRRIVLDKLNRVLPDLLGQLQMSMRNVSAELKDLVNTFNLTSKNILLQPAEWTLMGFVVLKLLSRKVKYLKEAFKQDYAVHFFNTVLHGLNTSPEQVRVIVHKMVKS